MSGGKVAVVGAGSASFGPSVVAGLVQRDDLRGVTLALHDIDGEAVERMGRLAELMVRGRGGDRRVTWTTDLGRALDGADCVVLSVAIDREKTWAADRAIALELGIEHYAENGGPAAIFHAGRNLALILPIAREIERRAPNDGAIANLPPGAVVETPVAFLPSGPRALACGALPEPVAELCRRQVTIAELGVQGIVEGDRDRLREALALDPMVDDPALPDLLLDRYLAACERYLAPFFRS